VLDFVVTNESVNFAYNLYAMENVRGIYNGSRVDSIRRNLRSIMKLDHIDLKKYQDEGEIRAVIENRPFSTKSVGEPSVGCLLSSVDQGVNE
jgi:hypothetical protein